MHNISDSEEEIMQIIWENGGQIHFATLMEKLENIGKKWKPNTALTFLARLVEKGMLSVQKQGRINLYLALCTKEEYAESLTQLFLNKVYGGDAKGLVAALVSQAHLSREDVASLQDFWEKEGKHE
jgi:BlaI family penicillinase repressor